MAGAPPRKSVWGLVRPALTLTPIVSVLAFKALVGAVGQAVLWWFVFSYVLEVYLPAGPLFGH